MLTIIARLEFAPKDVPAFIRAAQGSIALTRAEPGCELYAMATDISEPGVIWISEQWSSQAALDAHLTSAHIAEFLQRIGGLNMLSMDARQYEVTSVGPVIVPRH
jgi:quinol monooxygenase YgiN